MGFGWQQLRRCRYYDSELGARQEGYSLTNYSGPDIVPLTRGELGLDLLEMSALSAALQAAVPRTGAPNRLPIASLAFGALGIWDQGLGFRV